MALHLLFVVQLFVLFMLFSLVGAADLQKYTVRREHDRLRDSYVSQEVTSSSLMICLFQCEMVNDCFSISFKANENRCLLGKERVTHDQEAEDAVMFESGWVTMSTTFYTVFIIKKNMVSNNAEFAEADQMCAEYGSTVASPEDLMESRALGINFCSCSWLNDNTNGFVLQYEKPLCQPPTFSTDIIICGLNKANVWCRL